MSEPARFSFDWELSLWQRILLLFGCPITFQCRLHTDSLVVARCAGALLTFSAESNPANERSP